MGNKHLRTSRDFTEWAVFRDKDYFHAFTTSWHVLTTPKLSSFQNIRISKVLTLFCKAVIPLSVSMQLCIVKDKALFPIISLTCSMPLTHASDCGVSIRIVLDLSELCRVTWLPTLHPPSSLLHPLREIPHVKQRWYVRSAPWEASAFITSLFIRT